MTLRLLLIVLEILAEFVIRFLRQEKQCDHSAVNEHTEPDPEQHSCE